MTNRTGFLTGFAQQRPAAFMIIVTYVWTWSFWFTALNLLTDPQGLRLALILLGGFGPAMGGVLTLRLQTGEQVTQKKNNHWIPGWRSFGDLGDSHVLVQYAWRNQRRWTLSEQWVAEFSS